MTMATTLASGSIIAPEEGSQEHLDIDISDNDNNNDNGLSVSKSKSKAFDEEASNNDNNIGEDGDDAGGLLLEPRKPHSLSHPSALTPRQRLYANKRALRLSLLAVYFAVFCESANYYIVSPNHVLMVFPNAHEDSFETTEPFGFSSAAYLISMCSGLGCAVISPIAGGLSDKYGRRPVLIISLFGKVVFSLAMYFARSNFWTFCSMNFLNGFIGAVITIAIAYASDVHTDRTTKDAAIGLGIAVNMLGKTGGSVIATLMAKSGLFTPLLVGAGMVLAAGVLVVLFMVEPNKEIPQNSRTRYHSRSTAFDAREEEELPDVLHRPSLWNILTGALFDNFGSAGLVPICLSPLMFNVFYSDFVVQGESPVMSENAYRWIYSFVFLAVIPGALVSPYLFHKFGPALSCVAANIFTGGVQITLLYIGVAEPATSTTFVISVLVLYLGFPLTVTSQLSTAPMLDRITPADQRGYVQGLNMLVADVGQTMAPFALGLLADSLGINACIWIAAAISFLAGLVNSPLMFNPRFRRNDDKKASNVPRFSGGSSFLF
jgi:MFS family permease